MTTRIKSAAKRVPLLRRAYHQVMSADSWHPSQTPRRHRAGNGHEGNGHGGAHQQLLLSLLADEYERLKRAHHLTAHEFESLKHEHDLTAHQYESLKREHERLMGSHHMLTYEHRELQREQKAADIAWQYARALSASPPDSQRFQLQPAAEPPTSYTDRLAHPPFTNCPEVQVRPTRLRSLTEYAEFKRNLGEVGLVLEAAILADHDADGHFEMYGYCEACQKVSLFSVTWQPGLWPNFRESLHCRTCGLFSRLRRTVGYLRDVRQPEQRDIYLYEQVTGFFPKMQATFSDANVLGSEYLGDNIPSGTIIDGVRHEDAMSMSFADESLDFMVSCDVFEHVPDIKRTLAEASRVLRPNGQLVMTVPFHPSKAITVQRAAVVSGKLEHLHPPVYHRNPVSEEGSLVFFDYGWDFLDMCRATGFKDAYMLPYYSWWCAHLGDGLQSLFIAEK